MSFLALLDYVRRAHETEILPSCVIRPSVCGIGYLWTYCMDFFQLLVVASPGTYPHTVCLYVFVCLFVCFSDFWKKKYFSFSLTWDDMGAKISKRYSSYKSQPKVFLSLNLSWIFLSMILTKHDWDLWCFKFSILNDFFAKISNSPL